MLEWLTTELEAPSHTTSGFSDMVDWPEFGESGENGATHECGYLVSIYVCRA